jgi:cytochrome c-type biogenesis protein CcmF
METELHLDTPPQWAITVGDFGRSLVVFSCVLMLVAIIGHLLSPRFPTLAKIGRISFALGGLSVVGTFISLAVLFANNRFEYEYIWGHADTKNALAYRIAGIWSGQEGSFLLWATASAIFGLLAVWKLGSLQRWFTITYAAFLGGIMGILSYESPFKLILMEGKPVTPPEGQGLAPSLQNYWVIIHPPVIFLGFGLLTVLFALAIAALVKNEFDEWVPLVRPWAISAVTMVGVGLCMGGFWAYETLGWGGFWMWDPVENVSFVPWCLGAAFIHGILVQTARSKWKLGNLLLGGLPFLTFMYGTFLTRSGLLANASVHSFAEMERSALQLLIGMLVLAVGSFAILFVRSALFMKKQTAKADQEIKGLHREGFYFFGTSLLIAMGVATLIGMSVPFFMALQGRPPQIVEEKLYHMVLPWIFVPLMLIMAVTPFISWRGTPGLDFAKRVYSILCISIGLTGFMFMGFVIGPLSKLMDTAGGIDFPFGLKVPAVVWVLVLLWLCLFVIVGNVWRMAELKKASKLGWAPFITHAGVAILMAGLILSRGFERRQETIVLQESPGKLLAYGLRFDGMTSDTSDRENKVKLTVFDPHKKDEVLFTAMPGLYYVKGGEGEENPMVWPHIQRYPFHDLYITLHPPQKELTDAIEIAPGETKKLGSWDVTYDEMIREGEAGLAGTTFGAKIRFKTPHGEIPAVPRIELGQGGAIQRPAQVDDQVRVAMTSMDAATKKVSLQMQLATPMYPVEIFVKPFTGFVWLGTGIMTFGGFLSAYYRRAARRAAAKAKVPADDDFEPGRRAVLTS